MTSVPASASGRAAIRAREVAFCRGARDEGCRARLDGGGVEAHGASFGAGRRVPTALNAFVETTYCNPLIEEVWADPALAGPDQDGFYWSYATDDEHEPLPRRRFKVARSRDLVH